MESQFREQQGWSVLPTLYLRTVPTRIADLVVEMRKVHADFDLGLWPTSTLAIAHVKTLLTQNRRNAELWLEALPTEPQETEAQAASIAQCRDEVQLALHIATEGLRIIEEWEEKQRRPRETAPVVGQVEP
jgi:hypothetical protein